VGSTTTSPVEIQVGQSKVNVSERELQAFVNGTGDLTAIRRLLSASSSANRRLIVYGGGLDRAREDIRRAGFGAPARAADGLVDSTMFAARLRQQFRQFGDVYLASDPALALENATGLPSVRSAKDVAVLKGERIQDWGVVDDLEEALKKAQV